jgi:hypothetical protein
LWLDIKKPRRNEGHKGEEGKACLWGICLLFAKRKKCDILIMMIYEKIMINNAILRQLGTVFALSLSLSL